MRALASLTASNRSAHATTLSEILIPGRYFTFSCSSLNCSVSGRPFTCRARQPGPSSPAPNPIPNEPFPRSTTWARAPQTAPGDGERWHLRAIRSARANAGVGTFFDVPVILAMAEPLDGPVSTHPGRPRRGAPVPRAWRSATAQHSMGVPMMATFHLLARAVMVRGKRDFKLGTRG